MCCFLALLLFLTASRFLRQWNAPAWSFQILDGLAWGVGLAPIVAVGFLVVGLFKLFGADPYEEFSWKSAIRQGINFAFAPTLAIMWLISPQSKFGASMIGQWIPVVGAIVLSAHAIAVLSVTAALKARYAGWPRSRVGSILSIGFTSVLCVAIIIASVLERQVETLQLLWLPWIVVIVASSVSLAPRLQREIAMPLDGG